MLTWTTLCPYSRTDPTLYFKKQKKTLKLFKGNMGTVFKTPSLKGWVSYTAGCVQNGLIQI